MRTHFHNFTGRDPVSRQASDVWSAWSKPGARDRRSHDATAHLSHAYFASGAYGVRRANSDEFGPDIESRPSPRRPPRYRIWGTSLEVPASSRANPNELDARCRSSGCLNCWRSDVCLVPDLSL